MQASLSKTVSITQIINRMRGGSQLQLVQGDDGLYYVAKFAGNPQGTRTLINEGIIGNLLRTLGIATPELRILQLTEFCRRDDLVFHVGNYLESVQGQFHLGSQCLGNPTSLAIFDFLPSAILKRLENIADFDRTVVVDCWLKRADIRQAIFARRTRDDAAGWTAWMIDHGSSLGGPDWDLTLSSEQKHYFNSTVYRHIQMQRLIEDTVQGIFAIKDETLSAIVDRIPAERFGSGDLEIPPQLLDCLQARRRALNTIVDQHWPRLLSQLSEIHR